MNEQENTIKRQRLVIEHLEADNKKAFELCMGILSSEFLQTETSVSELVGVLVNAYKHVELELAEVSESLRHVSKQSDYWRRKWEDEFETHNHNIASADTRIVEVKRLEGEVAYNNELWAHLELLCSRMFLTESQSWVLNFSDGTNGHATTFMAAVAEALQRSKIIKANPNFTASIQEAK